MASFIIKSTKVLTPGGIKPAQVLIEDGVISKVMPANTPGPQVPLIDAGHFVIMPGLVDTHVHINEPGRTEWEGFKTATQAALAGGVTTVVDMPLNSSPVTTTTSALDTKLASAQGRLFCDAAFWGGVVPGNAKELNPMIKAGVLGFKAFLVHSGIDEFPAVTESDLKKAMAILAKEGVPLLVHAELESPVPANQHSSSPSSYASYLGSRPKSWENQAAQLLIKLCRQTGCRTHIVHLSSAEALENIAQAKSEGLPLTVETCPHYLTFQAGDIPDGATQFKCSPPIREQKNREALWQALRDGRIDFVVSDHSPCPAQMKLPKAGDFLKAWGGISGVQFGLAAVWTEAKNRGFKIENIAKWMSESPAQFAGLKRKGRIEAGYDADLIIWDPEASFKVTPAMIRHKHKLTPYEGKTLSGMVQQCFLRGNLVYDNERMADRPSGNIILQDVHTLH